MKNQGFRLNKASGSSGNTEVKKQSGPVKRPDPEIKPVEAVRLKGRPATLNNAPVQPDTSSWYTRNQGADALRMSVTTIATYERQGKLSPQYVYRPDSRGVEHRVAVYDPQELAKLRRVKVREDALRDPGEIAARSFELFNQGLRMRDVVIELRVQPDHVRQLHESWLTTGGADMETDLIITASIKRDIEGIIGSFTTPMELLHLIQRLARSKSEAPDLTA